MLVAATVGIASISGAIARPAAWPLPFLPVIALAGSTPVLIVAIALPALALAGQWFTVRQNQWFDREIGALLGAAAGVLLFQLERVDPIWMPTAAGLIGFGLVFLAALYSTTERGWRLGAGFAGTVFFLALLFTAVAGIGAWGLREQVDAASVAAERGLAAARRGDQQVAQASLIDAEDALAEVQQGLGSWWARPALLVPVVSQHVALANDLVDATAETITAARSVSDEADFSSLRISNGAVDVGALSAMATPLADLEQTLEATLAELDAERSVWILAPLDNELEVIREDLGEALPATRQAAAAARHAPPLLGADGPRTYAVMFLNPSTARPLGGTAEAIAQIRVNNGLATVIGEAQPVPTAEQWTEALDLPAALDAYQSGTGASVDGLLVVDPAGLAALLEITGPITTSFTGNRTFSAQDIETFLLIGQFDTTQNPELESDRARSELLGEIVGRALLEVVTSDIGTQSALVDVIGPAARAGHLRFTSTDSEEAVFLAGTFLNGELPSLANRTDVLAVLHSQPSTENTDPFLQRDVRYDVQIDPDNGALRSVLEISVANSGPRRSAPTLSILTPWNVDETSGVTLNGRSVRIRSSASDDGLQRHELDVSIEPNTSLTLAFVMTGTARLDSGAYALSIHRQALAPEDQMVVTVRRSDGAPLPTTGADVFEQVFDLDRSAHIDVPIRTASEAAQN